MAGLGFTLPADFRLIVSKVKLRRSFSNLDKDKSALIGALAQIPRQSLDHETSGGIGSRFVISEAGVDAVEERIQVDRYDRRPWSRRTSRCWILIAQDSALMQHSANLAGDLPQ